MDVQIRAHDGRIDAGRLGPAKSLFDPSRRIIVQHRLIALVCLVAEAAEWIAADDDARHRETAEIDSRDHVSYSFSLPFPDVPGEDC